MKRVLLVEDDRAIRRIVAHHLVKAGYEVLEAEDGAKAFDLARTTTVDLVLLDIRMPAMDGYELADRLAADPITADIPIVVCSVVADEAKARILRAKTFLLRPFRVDELVAAVHEAVNAR
jgi:CheY-like chemotaxis protein